MSFILLMGVNSCKKEEEEGPSQQEIDQQIIEDYIEAEGLDALNTESGLHYVIHNEGDDNHPTVASYIEAVYKGYYPDGVVFDDGSQLMSEFLYKLILGWQEGLPLIGEGGEIQLIIPSHLAYGVIEIDTATSYSVIIFDVELLQVYD